MFALFCLILTWELYDVILSAVIEKFQPLDWESVAEDGKESFNRFLESCRELGEKDPKKWSVQIVDQSTGLSALSARYSDGAKIEVHASMIGNATSGYLIMTAFESWNLETSEKVATQVSETMAHLLQESGLRAISNQGGDREGRNSYWKNSWKLFPSSHPRLKRK